MNPLVSVVVPVFNREKLIKRSLDSVFSQTYRPVELIVVDNSSTDSSLKNIQAWKQHHDGDSEFIIKILSESKRGACAARKKGEDCASGEFVIFFDSDDEMNPDLLKEAINAFKTEAAPDVVCWPCRIHQLDGTLKVPPFMPENPLEGHLIHTLFRPQGTMFRNEFLKKTGGWEKDISVWNDFELGLRVLLNNPKITGVKKILADIYSQSESITGKDFSSKEGSWEKTIEIMREDNKDIQHPLMEKIDAILDYREVILAAHYSREGNRASARKLLKDAIKKQNLLRKFCFMSAYYYTRKGGRGAWRILRYFI